jgi:hypothetical protein
MSMRAYQVVIVPALAALVLVAAPARSTAQVLVPGNPPLTRQLVDLDHAALEVVFDFRFTVEQRRESQRLLVEEWKGLSLARKWEWARNVTSWSKLPTWRNWDRTVRRALLQAKTLANLRKPDASERAHYLVGMYEAAFRSGSARNPVLVDGDPPLTQQLADRYRDYVEIMIDLSISGGFTAQERKVFQDYFVSDWKTMSAEERIAMLADLRTWADATAGGSGPETDRAVRALRPKLLAQLSVAGDNPRSQWLLGIVRRERQTFAQLSAINQQLHQTMRNVAGNIGPGGHWEYNGATGRYDRWVPDR